MKGGRSVLPVQIARCRPARYCSQQGQCARYMAEILPGSPLQDYQSTAPLYAHLWADCQMRIPPGDYTPQPEKRVHPPFGEQA